MNSLLRHGYGPAAELLDVTQNYHQAWCARNGWLLREDRGQKFDPIYVHYEKWRVIFDGLLAAEDGALVVYLDADAIVIGELNDVLLPAHDIGVTKWILSHYNGGAHYWRANAKTRAFAEKMAHCPDDTAFQHYAETIARFRSFVPDEPVFNKKLKESDLVSIELGKKWNAKSYMVDIRVLAFHGETDEKAKTELTRVVQEVNQWQH